MKIDGQNPAATTDNAAAARRASEVERRTTASATGAGSKTTDRIEVSSDAQLMAAALTAASETPAIRQDVVERAKEKLAKGELGADAAKLADALLDDVLGEK